MYSPFLVLPYHLSVEQWYTLDDVFTHTFPGPPPAAAVAGISVAFAADLAGAAAGAGVAAAALAPLSAAFFSSYQSLTPPCPAHAPRFAGADEYVPSLHSPVDPAGAWPWASAASIR